MLAISTLVPISGIKTIGIVQLSAWHWKAYIEGTKLLGCVYLKMSTVIIK